MATGGATFTGAADGTTLARSMTIGVDGSSASNLPARASPSLVMKIRNAKNTAVNSADAAAATTQSGNRGDNSALDTAILCQWGEMSSPARALK